MTSFLCGFCSSVFCFDQTSLLQKKEPSAFALFNSRVSVQRRCRCTGTAVGWRQPPGPHIGLEALLSLRAGHLGTDSWDWASRWS